MLAPISWLREFVDFDLPLKELMWKLTEAGLTCEESLEIEGETVLKMEITPNRPDWLSIAGIAREIAAITGKSVRLPKIEKLSSNPKLPLSVNTNFDLFPRYNAVILDNIEIKNSPDWLQRKLRLINLRSINNVVDITNYVMFELGIPLHAFDYDDIRGSVINVILSSGGEEFTSVDNLTYKLPKGAIVIKDAERIIDLCGIKGGLNSGIKAATKRVLLQVSANNPVLIRKASGKMALRSDASIIFERGVAKGETLKTLTRAANLVSDLAKGKIASQIIDLKKEEFEKWQINLSLSRMKSFLGIEIAPDLILKILTSLTLSPKLNGNDIQVLIPTYRGDLHLEEDLIEEIARIYGYNNLPQKLLAGQIPVEKIAHSKDFRLEITIKNLLTALGLNEVYTYSLVSKSQLENLSLIPNETFKVSNPVSLEFEYLRPTILGNLLTGIKNNAANFSRISLFELGKKYLKKTSENCEPYSISLVTTEKDFRSVKGKTEEFLIKLGLPQIKFLAPGNKTTKWPPFLNRSKSLLVKSDEQTIGYFGFLDPAVLQKFEIASEVIVADFDYKILRRKITKPFFRPIPIFPPLIEDLTFELRPKTPVGDIIESIKNTDQLIYDVKLIDIFQDCPTFRIIYQDVQKTLNELEVRKIRERIIERVTRDFSATLKGKI